MPHITAWFLAETRSYGCRLLLYHGTYNISSISKDIVRSSAIVFAARTDLIKDLRVLMMMLAVEGGVHPSCRMFGSEMCKKITILTG